MDAKKTDIYMSKLDRVMAFKWTGDAADMPDWASNEVKAGCGMTILAGKLYVKNIVSPVGEGEPYVGGKGIEVPIGNYVVQYDPYRYSNYSPEMFKEFFAPAKEAEPTPKPQKRLCMKNFQAEWNMTEVPTQESLDFRVNVQIEVFQGKTSLNLTKMPKVLENNINEAARGAIYEVMRRVMS